MTDARTWIGTSDPKDSLDLAKITASIPAEAKEIREILQSPRVSGMLQIRREASQLAATAQQRFKRLSLAAVLATAIATLASGLLLYGAGSDAATQPQPAVSQQQPAAPAAAVAPADAAPIAQNLVGWVKKNRTGIVVVQIFGLFVAAVAGGMLGFLGLTEVWNEQRKKAELLRRGVFSEILKQAESKVTAPLAAPDPCNAVYQALEFFRRYQHELQINYFAKGVARHSQAGRALSWMMAILAGVAAITGAMGSLGDRGLVISAFLGIAVPILLSAAQSWRASSRDSDKAAAYDKARDALRTNLLNIEDVRTPALLGDAAAVGRYFNDVHLIMTTENEEWRPAAKP